MFLWWLSCKQKCVNIMMFRLIFLLNFSSLDFNVLTSCFPLNLRVLYIFFYFLMCLTNDKRNLNFINQQRIFNWDEKFKKWYNHARKPNISHWFYFNNVLVLKFQQKLKVITRILGVAYLVVQVNSK